MTDKVKSFLIDGLIDQFEYDSYILFELNELGRIYLRTAIETAFLDPAQDFPIESTYAWNDGRRSVWREIKLATMKINKLLGAMHNERSKPRHPRKQSASHPGDPTGLGIFTDSI